MNRILPIASRASVAMLVSLCFSMASTNAQDYQAPNFSGMAGQSFHQASQIPAFPASPLAGGPAAANGGEFIDVQGNPIVVQTQFEQGCPPGYGGGMGGYGDPMAIDFGGYGQEQVGPHYFDISADVVFLQARELFSSLGPLSSAGAGPNAPRVLNPNDSSEDFEPGWQIAGRYDIGALSVLEASYMGLYDIGFSETIDATAASGLPFNLFTPFSNFGTGTIVGGFDFANQHTVNYESDLQSLELTYRRYWVGNNPRVSGTYLIGARYVRMTEDFDFTSNGLTMNGAGVAAPASLALDSENDLVGFQFGGDGWIGLRQGLRIGAEGKAGVYNNSYSLSSSATLPEDDDFAVTTSGDQVAFVAEGGGTIVADILPSFSIRGGYKVLFLNSIATAGASFPSTLDGSGVGTQGHALYHGFHGGLEYVW